MANGNPPPKDHLAPGSKRPEKGQLAEARRRSSAHARPAARTDPRTSGGCLSPPSAVEAVSHLVKLAKQVRSFWRAAKMVLLTCLKSLGST